MRISTDTRYRLSGNALKIIAAVSMLIDHIGVIFMPNVTVLRIIGRLAFPIFAFMIAEGCEYTSNKLRYFLSLAVLGTACQIVYYVYAGDKNMGILITFSVSVLTIFALQRAKQTIIDESKRSGRKVIALLLFLLLIAGVYLINQAIYIDYGFWGCMTPVLASVFRGVRVARSPWLAKLDRTAVHVAMFGIGLMLVAFDMGWVQVYSLMAIPLLLLYSGKRGKRKMKYFFYIYYPLHLLVLQGISAIL